MSPARRATGPDEETTRDALMDAALAQLTERGVLAGLNLREVADAVGVTPPNIYYYFGSRQGLLRAALARETERLAEPVAATADAPYLERRTAVFDAIGALPHLPLTALLALDGDPDYRPLPFIETTREDYARRIEAGELPADIDIEAVHLVALATSIGVAIYAEAAARQLDVPVDQLRDRTRAVFEDMVRAVSTG